MFPALFLISTLSGLAHTDGKAPGNISGSLSALVNRLCSALVLGLHWQCPYLKFIRGCHSPSENWNFPEMVKVGVANE